MNIDPSAAPFSAKDLSRRLKWIEDRLKYLASGGSYLNNGSVGGSVTITEILNSPGVGVEFFEDTTTATSDGGPVRVILTYLPKAHSEHVYWGGTYQPATEWVRDNLVLTFTEPHIKTGDIITVEYAYDPTDATAVPGPVITSPPEGTTTSDPTPTISGTGAPARSLEVFIDGVSVGTTTIADDGTWTITSSTLAIGSHTITATQTDADTTTRDATPVSFSIVSATPATATLRGGHAGHGGTVGTPTTWALPAGTVVGDLIAVMTNGLVTDPRMTSVGSGLYLGFATTTADLTVDLSAAPSGRWSISCITIATNAVAWTTATSTYHSLVSSNSPVAIPQISGIAATICGINDDHSVVDGSCTTPVGYTAGGGSSTGKTHSRVDFWVTGSLGTSPVGPSTFTGGQGSAAVVVVGLIGP